jgi:hypothetical protein
LFTNQIVNHFVNQKNNVQMDYLGTLVGPNQIVQIDMGFFFMLVILGFFFLLKYPIEKAMNCNSACPQGGL